MSTKPTYLATHAPLINDGLSEEAILVRDALLAHGLETPMIETGLSAEQEYDRIRGLLGEVVETLGLDLSDDSLAETPHRIAISTQFNILILAGIFSNVLMKTTATATQV